jgi:putative DNA primase/helicase
MLPFSASSVGSTIGGWLSVNDTLAVIKPELPLVCGANPNNRVIINGNPYHGVERKLLQNVMVLTETDRDIRDCLIYNIFADDIFFVKPPPWEDPETFKVHPLREDELLNYRCWVDTRGLIIGKNDASDILTSLARRNTKNPPKEYFEKLVWDKQPRLDKWLTCYLGAEDQNEHYLKLVGSKWMIAAVKRIYEPGCKFDNVLILEGDQYIGKSPSLEALATIGGERYFTDESIDFGGNKDSLMKLQGKLIFEMPELASFRKAETNEIKAFIGRGTDEYRPPYGRKIISRPRMFVFAGSVNPIAGYLTDPTGNKRYWPVKCGKIDIPSINRDKEQLWAEAVYRYKTKEQIWLEPEEHNLAKLEQQERMIDDIMSDQILEAAEKITINRWPVKDFLLSELVKELDLHSNQKDGKMRLRITDCLVANGYTEYRPRDVKGKQVRKWILKTDKESEEQNQPPASINFI